MADDQPIAAKRLVGKRTGNRASLRFLSTDAQLLYPTPGGPDDPRTAGLTIALAGENGEAGSLAVPAGDPGWSVRSGAVSVYKYRSQQSGGLRLALLQGRKLQLTANESILPLSASQGGVRLTIGFGALRNCAFFAVPRVDVPGRFEARDAAAPAACPTTTTTSTAATTSTTTTTPPSCSDENGTCLSNGDCCAGLECSRPGGTHTIGGCVGSCASRLHAVCASNIPNASVVTCCADQYCNVHAGGFPDTYEGTCETTPGDTQCCQFGPTCSEIPQLASCASPSAAGPSGTVCDGATGSCAAAHTGESGCCQISTTAAFQRCVEGPGAADLCLLVSGASYHAGWHCGTDCVAP